MMKKNVDELKSMIEALLQAAKENGISEATRNARVAEAAAYVLEISFAKNTNSTETELDVDRVNRNIQIYMTYFGMEENRNDPEHIAELPFASFSTRMEDIAEEYRQCAAPSEFGTRINPSFQYQLKLEKDESIEYARSRAGQIFQQMDRTWRIMGSSKQFGAAKNAMKTIADLTSPTQLDFFTAAVSVKAYVSKNLQAAASAVGRTRMACAMAFLKQIMGEKSFQDYCNQLNNQRGITWGVSQDKSKVSYDKTNPRCFVPEEIGTVKEVYQNVRNRISLASVDGAPSSRDLAMLAALKSLQARSQDGEALVVEHEALQAEIEKVQANPSFQAVLQGPRDELLMMALEGNLDTIQGCQNGLSQEQKNRIAAERQRLADELAKREEAERQELLKAQQEEAMKREQDRQREEQRKYEEENPRIVDLYRKQMKVLDGMMHPLHNAFLQFENLSTVSLSSKGAPEQESVELTANLIALNEFTGRYEKGDRAEEPRVNLAELQARVEALKNDELIRQQGAQFMAEERWPQYNNELMKRARENGLRGERAEIYPAVQMGIRLAEEYRKGCADRALQKPRTVAAYYAGNMIQKRLDNILAMHSSAEENLKIVAAMLVLREHEKRLGLDAKVEPQFLAERTQLLTMDPDVIAASRQLMQPETNRRLNEALQKKPNRTQAFGEFLEALTLELKANREKASEPQAEVKQNPAKDNEKRRTEKQKRKQTRT